MFAIILAKGTAKHAQNALDYDKVPSWVREVAPEITPQFFAAHKVISILPAKVQS